MRNTGKVGSVGGWGLGVNILGARGVGCTVFKKMFLLTPLQVPDLPEVQLL